MANISKYLKELFPSMVDTKNIIINGTVGSDTLGNGTTHPYQTIGKAVTVAQFPADLYLFESFTENVVLTNAKSNINLIGSKIYNRYKVELNGNIQTSSADTNNRFVRLGVYGINIKSGASSPVVLGSFDGGKHCFENVAFTTSAASLVSIPSNFYSADGAWLNFLNCDFSGSLTSVLVLPDLDSTNTATLRLYNCGFVNISVGKGWTVYYTGDTVLNVTSKYSTALIVDLARCFRMNSIITSQVALDALIAITNHTADGAYLINFAGPTGITGIAAGDVISKNGSVHMITMKYADAPAQVMDFATNVVYVKKGTLWGSIATVGFTGSYNDLINKPNLESDRNNYLINGDMRYWQRNNGIVNANQSTLFGSYSADKGHCYFSAGATKNFTWSRDTDVPTESQAGYKFPYSLKINSNIAHSIYSQSNSEEFNPYWQACEGLLCADMKNGDTLSLSFWAKSNRTGGCNFNVYVQINGIYNSANSWIIYPLKVVINSNEINAWKKFTIDIPVTIPTGFTPYYDNNACLTVSIGHLAGTGSSFKNSNPNQWTAPSSTTFSPNVLSASENWADSANNFIKFTGLKITNQNDYNFSLCGRNSIEELRLCQRYFEKSYQLSTTPGTAEAAGQCRYISITTSDVGQHSIKFQVRKRSAPSIVIYAPHDGTINKATQWGTPPTLKDINIFEINDSGFNFNSNSQFQIGYPGGIHFIADCEL